ncbi:MAG: hypothetical protein KF691_14330 [Phycisphaeraceae bacterium]|nr:hypothetical protein [Phycisphaeraceae bacterium]
MADSRSETQKEPPTSPGKSAWVARWGKRAGVVAFTFFLVKGLAWLVVPVALAAWWSQ